jgi:hypothetical protein
MTIRPPQVGQAAGNDKIGQEAMRALKPVRDGAAMNPHFHGRGRR